MLIRLQLVRELHPHFPKDADDMSSHADHPDRPHWHLFGANDFLVATKIESLPMLGEIYGGGNQKQNDDEIGQTTSIASGGVQEWVLCDPFSNNSSLINEGFATLSNKEGGPLLIIAASFSSVFFDNLRFDQIHSATESTVREIKQHLYLQGFSIATVLSSIGGMDLTLIISLENRSLTSAFQVLQQLRDFKRKNGNTFHHYFSQVNAFFCFQNHKNLPAHAEDNFKVISRTRTVCGHQTDFLLSEDKDAGAIQESYLTMGTYSVTQIFNGLKSLASCDTIAMNKVEHLKACKGGFDGRRTEIAFPVGKKTNFSQASNENHASITLTKPLNDFGILIDDAIYTLTKRYSSVTGREVAKALLAIRKSLTRNERLGSLRDLFPFISQLCHCIKGNAWKLLDPQDSGIRESTMSSALDLTTHLWRAIRNRIESRVESLDPSFPGTLDSGISKLLNGYSVAAWLCSSIFDLSEHQRTCTTDSFAACVAAGYSGRIQTQEVFADLRKLHEEISTNTNIETARRIDGNAVNAQDQWNSRLLLLDISGRAIFRPEIAFLHCMHELAEFTDWWTRPKAGELRIAINQLQFHLLASRLYDSDAIGSTNLRASGGSDAETRFSEIIMQILVCSLEVAGKFVQTKNIPIETEFIESTSRKLDPTWFLITILLDISNLDENNEDFINHLAKFHIEKLIVERLKEAADKLIKDEFTGKILPDIKKSRDENSKLNDNSLVQLRNMIREIVADYSMIYAYAKIRKSVSENMEMAIDQPDIDYAFGCIVEQTVSWLPAVVAHSQSTDQSKMHTQSLKDIIYRWLVQKYMVWHVRKAAVVESESDLTAYLAKNWVKDFIMQVTYSICLFDKRGNVDKNFKKDVENLVTNCVEDFDDTVFGGFDDASLAASLAKLLKDDENSLIDENFLKTEPPHSILKDFVVLWKTARNLSYKKRNGLIRSGEDESSGPEIFESYQVAEIRSNDLLENLRMKFSWTLWAKSQKLCFEKCFEVTENEPAAGTVNIKQK
jgi:hypothetical protein